MPGLPLPPAAPKKVLVIGAGLSGLVSAAAREAGLAQNLEGVLVKVWDQEPWVRGGLALPGPGQLTSICVGAERPEGRVHFAGEHLSTYSGWMQGALQSGLRGATEVNAAP